MPAVADDSGVLVASSPLSAILLGSPGVMTVEGNVDGKISKGGSKGGLEGVLRDLMLARAFLSKNSYSIVECMHGMRLFRYEFPCSPDN
jgi:hypothetical protein